MGESPQQATPESTASMLQSYAQYLPSVLQATAGQEGNLGMAQYNNTATTQPLYNALNLDQLQQYAVPTAKVGQEVANSNAIAGAQTNVDQLRGAGGEAARAANDIARETNPNYYKVQDASSNKAVDLLNSINLNGLSPGEANAVERSTNQSNAGTGNLGLSNNTNAISNAMNFGGAYNEKLGLLGNALGAANGVATSAQNTGFNPVNIALGQPNASTMGNFGTGTFSPTNAQTGAGNASNTLGFGSGLLGNITSANNAQVGANAQMGAAQINANSPASYLGAVCCFIFLEAYRGNIPKHVRKSRDRYYKLNPEMAAGYRRMAKWLVPAMQSSTLVRELVWVFMVLPITQHTGFVNRKAGWPSNKAICHFWLKVWSIMGRGKKEEDYAMKWNYTTERSA